MSFWKSLERKESRLKITEFPVPVTCHFLGKQRLFFALTPLEWTSVVCACPEPFQSVLRYHHVDLPVETTGLPLSSPRVQRVSAPPRSLPSQGTGVGLRHPPGQFVYSSPQPQLLIILHVPVISPLNHSGRCSVVTLSESAFQTTVS